jgi:phthalate 4,5-dioxygenase
MLTREENEWLTRAGPGTPMGEPIRRYWIPVLAPFSLPRRARPGACEPFDDAAAV